MRVWIWSRRTTKKDFDGPELPEDFSWPDRGRLIWDFSTYLTGSAASAYICQARKLISIGYKHYMHTIQTKKSKVSLGYVCITFVNISYCYAWVNSVNSSFICKNRLHALLFSCKYLPSSRRKTSVLNMRDALGLLNLNGFPCESLTIPFYLCDYNAHKLSSAYLNI